jgi:hypothetical protein
MLVFFILVLRGFSAGGIKRGDRHHVDPLLIMRTLFADPSLGSIFAINLSGFACW